MLLKLFVVFATCVAQGLGYCVNGSSAFDSMLQGYSTDLEVDGLQYFYPIESQSEHPLSILGVNLPLGVSLDLSNGVLGPLDLISRTNDAEKCTSGISTSITSIIKYDNLALTFWGMTAKFLFWEMKAKTTINLVPCFNTEFTNVRYLGTNCSMTLFEWQDTCDPHVNINIPYHSWTDYFVGFFVRRALNSSPLPQQAKNQMKTYINLFLTKYWCGLGL
uniref:Uncharacterized protein n=1 Tax=Lygus hesperus TaxID=30085 RepID=A0A146KRG4_LYGHE